MNGIQDGAAVSSARGVEVAAGSRIAWTQVVLASVLMLATLPGRTQGLGLVTEPLLADLHLDRTTYANMNLWATLLGALACFPTGWAIDRIGLRWVTAGIVLFLGITVWQLSAVTASVTLIFTLLLANRTFGQSALSVCSIATVARWFPRRSGYAMGIYSVLLSVWFAVAFGVIGYSVRVNGWRSAWLQIALALIFVIVPMVVLVLREPKRTADLQSAVSPSCDRPSQGNSERSESANGQRIENPLICPTGETGDSLTFAQALRTAAFWLFASAAALFNLVSSGLGLFNEAVLAERGFDQKTFHVFLAVSTLMSLGGQFLCGWLTRRSTYQTLACIALMLYAAGLAGIALLTQHWQLWLLAVLLGIAGGMIIVIFFSVWSDLFGQRHLGRIQGTAQMLTVLSSGLGPLLFAKCAALSGSYAPLLFALAGISALLALVVKGVRVPNDKCG